MTRVLGPLTTLRDIIEAEVKEYQPLSPNALRVNISEPNPKSNDEQEISVQEEKKYFFGYLKKYRTVVALVYPYHSWCVVTDDLNYKPLSQKIKSVIEKSERGAFCDPHR